MNNDNFTRMNARRKRDDLRPTLIIAIGLTAALSLSIITTILVTL